jgi:large subunit ribosomal protein L10
MPDVILGPRPKDFLLAHQRPARKEKKHLPTQKRIDQTQDIQDRLSRCTIAVATDPTGLTVNVLNDLRRRLRERGIEYRVVKNTLTYLAADGAELSHLKDSVQGPTALAFGYDDPVQTAAALDEYVRTTRVQLPIRGGILGRRALSSADVSSLATLPSREVLAGQVLGQLQAPVANLMTQLEAPIQGILGILNGPITNLTSLLQQRGKQLEGGG